MAKASAWIWAGLATLGGAAAVILFSTPPKTTTSKPTPSDLTTPPAPPPAPVSEPLLKAGQTLVLIGDSIANGLARQLAPLAANAGVTFRYAAQDSSTITQWAARVRDDVAVPSTPDGQRPIYGTSPSVDESLHGADVVVLSLGSNDSAGEAPSLSALVARLRDVYGAKVVWLVPPMFRPGTKASDQRQGAISSLFATNEVEPLVAGSALVPLAPDNVHPTAAGYKQLAENMMSALLHQETIDRRTA